VGAFYSATGAIESALKYVSPDANWIARRLATAGGKHIKTRLLGTVVTDRFITNFMSVSGGCELLVRPPSEMIILLVRSCGLPIVRD
jgi:hypothetical protein